MTVKKENRELKLKIGVKDFGPISSGIVDVKPFTLLIGPNNSGKSYFSMLLHSVFKSFNIKESLKYDIKYVQKNFFSGNIKEKNVKDVWKEYHKIEQKIKSLKRGDEFEIPITFINRMSRIVFDEKNLSREIIRLYACQPGELIRNNKQTSSLKVEFNSSGIHFDFKKSGLKIKKYLDLNPRIKVRVSDTSTYPDKLQINKKGSEYLFVIERERLKHRNIDDEFLLTFLHFMRRYLEDEFENVAIPRYYLPAARSGILHGHKILVSNIVRNMPYDLNNKLETPKLSGIVSDFLSSLIELSDEKGLLFDLTREFEKELIKGEVAVKIVDDYRYPEMKYCFKDKEIPLYRSSSTVSEIAPLTLYLKYRVEPGSILIIEEPEAHLHPENQRILAKFLVRLIRKGVKLFITTHSDYLLDQLSSFIMLSQARNKKQREELNYWKDDYLKPEEIGVYVFHFDKKSDGCKIEEVEISEEEGISQEEFLKVNEALYEESIRIRESIQAKKG
jgi:predicted ATPase